MSRLTDIKIKKLFQKGRYLDGLGLYLNIGKSQNKNWSFKYTKNLIKRWRDFSGDKSSLYSSGGDQEILCRILKKSDEGGFNRKIFKMNEFNTDPRLVNNDTFILHFMAYPLQLKKILM